MPTSKTRKKKYVPRQIKTPSILTNLPVPPVMVQKLNRDMSDRMLRLRLSGFNGKDLAALVVCFGEAWLLAGQMEQGDSLRNKLETGVYQGLQNHRKYTTRACVRMIPQNRKQRGHSCFIDT